MNEYRRGHRSGRVVLVEPHDDTRELYATYLEWAGVRVVTAPTAARALRIVRREPADAVITCLRLPDRGGFALCDALWALPSFANRTPVIAISSCIPDHERAVSDPRFAAVLMKPCLPETLLGSLRRAIATGDLRLELVPSPSDLLPATQFHLRPDVRG